MNEPVAHVPDPSLDLLLERYVDLPVELVWKAWTTPELIKQWFTPRPWVTADCVLDLRPGGIFRTVMRGPDGQEFSGNGCVLEVVEGKKFAWTSAMGPGYRPNLASGSHGELVFSAIITFERHGAQTKYSALVIHADEESRIKHEVMGFYGGWATALDQLVELMTEQA